MAFPWEFFEELGEMVYVSDLETDTLVYMNASLRNALGVQSHEEYVGKKCYDVLQGNDSQCSFCNKGELEPGKIYTRTHTNPIMNRKFQVKDSVFYQDGKKYRIQIAIDMGSEKTGQISSLPARAVEMLNGCLQRVFATTSPDIALNNILAYMGEKLLCDRAYIFEWNHSDRMRNTYEWCAKGVVPQKHILQNESVESIQCLFPILEEKKVIVIDDMEQIGKQYPAAYAFFKSLDISSFAAGPIKRDGEIIGFVGVDEPDPRMMPVLKPMLEVIGYFVLSLLKGRELIEHLRKIGLHDPLTGAFNRNALIEFNQQSSMPPAGVIYCDITGLKKINDVFGHVKGDQMIRHCYELIHEALDTDLIYRTGGDEFVVLCPQCEKDEFNEKVRQLRRLIRKDEYHIAIGSAWSDQHPLQFDDLIAKADRMMYENKRNYYAWQIIAHDADQSYGVSKDMEKMEQQNSQFRRFLENTYYDMEMVFESIAQQNSSSYFYFGDMQKDLFYISDNMRDDFGFESNVVSGLFRAWSQRISTPEFQDIFWQDVSAMLREKRTLHDLRYQVRDMYGNIKWVQCYGIMKWSEDKRTPLFFSGRVSHQDDDFVIDPITNFPRETAAFGHLNELRKTGQKTQIISFSLNSITEINSTKGRAYADRLIKNIANRLTETLSWKMTFHRLEGMRCMAVVNPLCVETDQAAVEQIRDIIEDCYESMGIAIRNVCSFALMEYPCEDLTPEDMVENLVALIRIAKQETDQPFMEYSIESIKRIQQMSNMALALEQDVLNDMKNFRVVVQPVVSAKDGSVIGGETLLRWTFKGKDVSPAVFIPILEKDNMIHIAGRWVFEQAARNCMQMITYNPQFYLTFNVSLHQLSDTELLSFMEQTLEKYQLNGSHLVTELTESCLDEQPEMLEHFVEACGKMGMRIALDDFGSGYSSLRMLLQYPSSIIKLDRSLLQEITESDQKMHFIRSIVYACHQFGKKVCMEGVERTDQNTIIRDTGCDMIQGYYYYRPMELGAVYSLLSEKTH
ncbi:bifunctional diguanylate cyclase/phosphodiesterase [Agathobaculum sp. LCP25S3_E8]|uniref:bifunctional diguanylate cyclase/phosphodiesterase n=1 Tax=Agathobaculum sp. LCP25S3_E8 TaxID=3438735 RepID=UPI003F906901